MNAERKTPPLPRYDGNLFATHDGGAYVASADYDALAAQLAAVEAREETLVAALIRMHTSERIAREAAEAKLARVQACPRYAIYAIGRETTFIEQQDDGEFQYAADVRAAVGNEP